MKLRDFDVCIECEGKPLEEYDIQFEGENTVNCYVASEAGKHFLIHGRNHAFQDLLISCYCDGRFIKSVDAASQTKWCIRTTSSSQGIRRKLLFSSVQYTDDDAEASASNVYLKLGMLEIFVRRITGRFPAKRRSCSKTEEVGPIHERSKKLGAHCVSFGEKQKLPPGVSFYDIECSDTIENPFIKFNFRYRPRDILQAQGIIPLPQPSVQEKGKKRAAAETEAMDPPQSSTNKRHRPEQHKVKDAERSSSSHESKDPSRIIEEDVKPIIDDEDDAFETLKSQVNTMTEMMASNMKAMQAMQSQLAQMASKRGKPSGSQRMKREPSPIRLGAQSGDVVDLTLD